MSDGSKEEQVAHAFNRGVALALEEKAEEALVSFEAALVLDPTHVGAMDGKGRALNELGRTQAALQAFTDASRLDPEEPEHALEAALCMLELGLVGKAHAALTRVSRSDEARRAWSVRVMSVAKSFMVRASRWRDRGVQRQELVGYRLGEACYRIALDLSPRSAEAARGLATAASALGNKKDAIRWARLVDRLTTLN